MLEHGNKSCDIICIHHLINTLLLNIKDDVDDVCLDNDDIITIKGIFSKKITGKVTRRFKQEKISTNDDIRTFVTGLIEKEYRNSVYTRA